MTQLPTIIDSGQEIRRLVRQARQQGQRIGLVPTMGALHTGHLSLVTAAQSECDLVVVSIYVNPTQFAPHEDFHKYPRGLLLDQQLLATDRPCLIFAPSNEQMYPPNFQTMVEVGPLAQAWEGAIRPTHFRGVATIVLKLFTYCEPDAAYFGQKDFQQLRVIEQMTADLNLAVEIRACPIARDHDGMALSSRNRYLSPDERVRGLQLSRALAIASAAFARGERRASEMNAAMQDVLQAADLKVDYAVVVDRATLQPLFEIDRPAVALIAARVGNTRLIDNLLLNPTVSDC